MRSPDAKSLTPIRRSCSRHQCKREGLQRWQPLPFRVDARQGIKPQGTNPARQSLSEDELDDELDDELLEEFEEELELLLELELSDEFDEEFELLFEEAFDEEFDEEFEDELELLLALELSDEFDEEFELLFEEALSEEFDEELELEFLAVVQTERVSPRSPSLAVALASDRPRLRNLVNGSSARAVAGTAAPRASAELAIAINFFMFSLLGFWVSSMSAAKEKRLSGRVIP